MTQKELAQRLGISLRQLQRWEDDDLKTGLSQSQLRRLSDIFGVAPEAFLAQGVPSTLADVELAPATPATRAMRSKGLRHYRVTSDVLIEAGIAVGSEITFDETEAAIEARAAGDILLLRADNLLIMRQFMPPRLVTTNRDTGNIATLVIEGVKIVGVAIKPAVED